MSILPGSFRLFIVLFFSVASLGASAQYHYDFNDRCQQAYEAFISLRIKEGNALIDEERKLNPNNLIAVFVGNYGDCLSLMLNGAQTDYKELKPRMDARLSLIEKGNPESPWFLYTKAALNFQIACVSVRFNEYFSGGAGFRRSYLQLKENQKKFPDFKYTQVLLGLEEAIASTIPDNYKWLANALGVRGDLTNGMSKISNFLNDKSSSALFLREEALFYYCYLRFYLFADRQGTWRFINSSGISGKDYLLFTYMKANLAIDDFKANLAEELLDNRNRGSEYLKVPLFDYQSGVVALQKMEDKAAIHFQRFLDHYSGRFFIKSAYQKLSYHYLLKGDLQKARAFKNKILTEGTTEIDVDKQALRYAKSGSWPNVQLLRAKLYCDGGYFNKAIATLGQVKIAGLDLEELTEYYYRFGQASSLTGNKETAVSYFVNAMNLGKSGKGQYAARSALDLARLYEEQGNKAQAIETLKACLAMKNHDFQAAIDQRAKSALRRLQGN